MMTVASMTSRDPRARTTEDTTLESSCRQARLGDRTALEQLLRGAEQIVWRICWRGAGGRTADAEDILQETLLRAVRGIAGYDPDRPFAAWLKGIAARAVADLHRKRGARTRLHDRATDAAEADAGDRQADAPTPSDERERLAAALDGLPPPTRAVLLLHHGEGFSVQETAQLTGLGVEAVKKRLQRGRAELRERLS